MKSAKILAQNNETKGSIRVDDWPNPPRANKTVTIHADQFIGAIVFEESLSVNPTEDDWYIARTEEFSHEELTETQNRVFNLRDRAIWMRVVLEIERGRVDRVLII